MAAATLNEVCDAIADHLTSQLSDVYVHARWPGSTQFPALVVYPPTLDAYHQSFSMTNGGLRSLEVELWALVASADGGLLEAAQQTVYDLADWSGSSSVYAAIEADRTLGGEVGDCVLRSFAPLMAEEVAGSGYIGGKFVLTVQATR